jgi:PrsW family intramembrane metalloprotease
MDTLRPRVQRFGVLRLAAIVVSLAAFAYLWIHANGRFPEATVWEVPLVLELLLLSMPWRTVSARTVARYFFIGVGPVFLLTVWSQALLSASPLNGWLTDLSGDWALSNVGGLKDVHSTVWAPITEELGKLLPLLVALWWGRSHLRSQGGPLDFAILAAAVGAGLGFTEDLFVLGGFTWSTPHSPLLGLGVGSAYIGLVANTLNQYPLPVFDFSLNYQGIVGIFDPSVEELQLGAVWAGHAVLPMLTGLAIGFAVMARRRGLTRLVVLLPVLTLLWATWDHFVGNWYSFATCSHPDSPTLCGLAQIDFIGGLLPLVAIAAWALAMFVSQRVVVRQTPPAVALTRNEVRAGAYRGGGPTWPIRLVRDWLHYLALRNRSAFGVTEAGVSEADANRYVASRLQAGILAARLRNESLPELPARWRARLAEMTSRI